MEINSLIRNIYIEQCKLEFNNNWSNYLQSLQDDKKFEECLLNCYPLFKIDDWLSIYGFGWFTEENLLKYPQFVPIHLIISERWTQKQQETLHMSQMNQYIDNMFTEINECQDDIESLKQMINKA